MLEFCSKQTMKDGKQLKALNKIKKKCESIMDDDNAEPQKFFASMIMWAIIDDKLKELKKGSTNGNKNN